MRVLDASVVVEWLKGGERNDAVLAALREDGAAPFMAPDLIDIEVVSALRRMVRDGHVTEVRATQAVGLLSQLPIDRHSGQALVPRIWALRHNLSACDAAYVALAEASECPLLTCDRRLAAAPSHVAEVCVVG